MEDSQVKQICLEISKESVFPYRDIYYSVKILLNKSEKHGIEIKSSDIKKALDWCVSQGIGTYGIEDYFKVSI